MINNVPWKNLYIVLDKKTYKLQDIGYVDKLNAKTYVKILHRITATGVPIWSEISIKDVMKLSIIPV